MTTQDCTRPDKAHLAQGANLRDLSQRLKAAVGMAGAAHAVFEMGNDETSDAGRWTLEEAVKNLRDIDIGIELAARRCHCESRQVVASREATSTDAAEEQSAAEDGSNSEDDAVQFIMDIFHRNVEAILNARADSMSPEDIARIRALLKGEHAALAVSSHLDGPKVRQIAEQLSDTSEGIYCLTGVAGDSNREERLCGLRALSERLDELVVELHEIVGRNNSSHELGTGQESES